MNVRSPFRFVMLKRFAADPRGLLLVAVTLGLTSLLMWPALMSPAATFPGNASEDSAFVAAYFNALAVDGSSPFSLGTLHSIGWPEGIANPGAINLSAPLSLATTWLLGLALGSVEAQLALAAIALALSMFVAGWFTWDLTRHPVVMVFGAVAVGLVPITIHWVSALPALAQTWLLLLVAMFSLRLVTQPEGTRRWPLGLALVAAVLWHPYFAAFAGLIFVAAALWALAYRRQVPAALLQAGIPGIAIGAVGAVVAVSRPLGLADRDADSAADLGLFRFSWFSHDFSFVAPDGRSYVPWAVLILAVASIAFAIRRFRHRRSAFQTQVGVLALVVLVSIFAFSISEIAGIPLPRRLLLVLIPELRQGWYAMVLVQTSLALLAALGIWLLIRLGGTSRAQRVIVVFGAIALIAFQLRLVNPPAHRWMEPTPINLSATREWVAAMPAGPVLALPWDVGGDGMPSGPGALPCLAVSDPRHPVVNECGLWLSDQGPRRLVDRIREAPLCRRIDLAIENGVKHFLVFAAPVQPRLQACLRREAAGGLLRLVPHAPPPVARDIAVPDAGRLEMWSVTNIVDPERRNGPSAQESE